jgi:hypothetical protein
MKYLFYITILGFLASCSTSIKLAIPEKFKEEAMMLEVKGSRKRKMSFGDYSTSKIKRGVNISYPGWGKWFVLENLFLQKVGVQINETVQKRKHNFKYTLTNGKKEISVYAKEREMTKTMEYSFGKVLEPVATISRMKNFQYVFSAVINTDSANNNWELLMTNMIDNSKDIAKSFFPIIKPDEAGFATNGTDTIIIRPLSLKDVETNTEKKAWLPFKVLSGYELSTKDGVIAIIDLIKANIWMYKELYENEKLIVAGISTAILGRRINNNQW